MAGWNGAGVYDLRYTFVNDALAGIKILASRQDAMWNDLKIGIQNCLTLDGQNSPTQDINLNSHKITNLAAGVLPGDAVRFDQIVGSEWISDDHAISWVSATVIKVLAVDATTTYAVGRRLKFLDNGVLRYATVVDCVFSTPDTVLTLLVDGGSALVGPITDFAYGISANIYRWSKFLGTGSASITSGSTTILQGNFATAFDELSEVTSGRLTSKTGGTYLLEAIGVISAGGANIPLGTQFALGAYLNGSLASGGSGPILSWPFATGVTNHYMPLSMGLTLSGIGIGDILDIRLTAQTFTVASAAWQGGLKIMRIGT